MSVFRRFMMVAILVVTGIAATAAVAGAQGVTGGCRATVNGQTLDTLTRKTPLVVAKGDTVDLVGTVPAGAGDGAVSSQTDIYVEVIGDIPVASETGSGPSWGGTVTVPNVITQLAPGVYKVKGTATGDGWVCDGSAYVKVEGGPLTVATAIGMVLTAAGAMTVVRSRQPKKGQVFDQAAGDTSAGATRETGTGVAADAITIGLLALLVALVGSLGPSWVVL